MFDGLLQLKHSSGYLQCSLCCLFMEFRVSSVFYVVGFCNLQYVKQYVLFCHVVCSLLKFKI